MVGWADLSRPDTADQLRAAQGSPGGPALVAVRHQLQEEPDQQWLARPQVRAGLRAVAAAGLAYDLVISPHQLPLVTETVAALPEVRFVLDHAGKPAIASGDLSAWTADLRALAARPNVAVKLSGLVTEADWDSWTPGAAAAGHGVRAGAVRPGADHVRLGLAGVPAGGQLRRGGGGGRGGAGGLGRRGTRGRPVRYAPGLVPAGRAPAGRARAWMSTGWMSMGWMSAGWMRAVEGSAGRLEQHPIGLTGARP